MQENILKVLISLPSDFKIGNLVHKEMFTDIQPGQLAKPSASRQICISGHANARSSI